MNDIFNNIIICRDMENIFKRGIPIKELYNTLILVTGATGMLASDLIYYLIWLNEKHDAGIRIVAVARHKEKILSRFGNYAEKSYFNNIIADVSETLTIDGDVDYIVHAASFASPQYYTTMPVEVALPNAVGTYYLLQLAVKKHVKGFLYFSSGDVYGKMPDNAGMFREEQMGTMDPMGIHSYYGESKRMGETWCASFAQEYGLSACAVSIGHTYAPTMDLDNDPRVFASFMKCAVEKKDIVMLSDGSAKRPFCYIADAIAAFVILLIKGKPGEAYNMTNTDAFVSIGELAEIIASIEPEANLEVIRKQREKDDNYLENSLNHANCHGNSKLKKLGWECEYDIRKGFSQVLEYYSMPKSS